MQYYAIRLPDTPENHRTVDMLAKKFKAQGLTVAVHHHTDLPPFWSVPPGLYVESETHTGAELETLVKQALPGGTAETKEVDCGNQTATG